MLICRKCNHKINFNFHFWELCYSKYWHNGLRDRIILYCERKLKVLPVFAIENVSLLIRLKLNDIVFICPWNCWTLKQGEHANQIQNKGLQQFCRESILRIRKQMLVYSPKKGFNFNKCWFLYRNFMCSNVWIVVTSLT